MQIKRELDHCEISKLHDDIDRLEDKLYETTKESWRLSSENLKLEKDLKKVKTERSDTKTMFKLRNVKQREETKIQQINQLKAQHSKENQALEQKSVSVRGAQ